MARAAEPILPPLMVSININFVLIFILVGSTDGDVVATRFVGGIAVAAAFAFADILFIIAWLILLLLLLRTDDDDEDDDDKPSTAAGIIATSRSVSSRKIVTIVR